MSLTQARPTFTLVFVCSGCLAVLGSPSLVPRSSIEVNNLGTKLGFSIQPMDTSLSSLLLKVMHPDQSAVLLTSLYNHTGSTKD